MLQSAVVEDMSVAVGPVFGENFNGDANDMLTHLPGSIKTIALICSSACNR